MQLSGFWSWGLGAAVQLWSYPHTLHSLAVQALLGLGGRSLW